MAIQFAENGELTEIPLGLYFAVINCGFLAMSGGSSIKTKTRPMMLTARPLISPFSLVYAMQQHLETLVGRKTLLFDSLGLLETKSVRLGDVEIPQAVTEVLSKMPAVRTNGSKGIVVDDRGGSAWLVRPVSTNTADFGVIAVDLGRPSEVFDELRARVVALIADAGLSLERLGLARTISEARTREETEQFREALIGSVSHELRTPLSSILGASTVLSLAPEITDNARLKELAALIHQDSERLNSTSKTSSMLRESAATVCARSSNG